MAKFDAKKADLDKDGQLSSYEKNRGKATAEAMPMAKGYAMQMGEKEIDSPGTFSARQSKVMQMSPLRMTDPVKVEQADPSAWTSTSSSSDSKLGTGPGGIPTITTTTTEDFERGTEGTEAGSGDASVLPASTEAFKNPAAPGQTYQQFVDAPCGSPGKPFTNPMCKNETPPTEGSLETKQEITTDAITAPSRDVYTNFEARQAQRNVGQAFRKAKRATIREERGALRSKLKGSDMTREERKAERKAFRNRKREIKANAKKLTAQGKRAVAQDVLNQVLGGKSAGSQSRFVSGTDKAGKNFQEQQLVTLMKPMQFKKIYKK